MVNRTGYGHHADYVFGWKGDALQRAMDVKNGCFAADCGNQKTQNNDAAARCQISKKVREDVEGCKFPLMSVLCEFVLTCCHRV